MAVNAAPMQADAVADLPAAAVQAQAVAAVSLAMVAVTVVAMATAVAQPSRAKTLAIHKVASLPACQGVLMHQRHASVTASRATTLTTSSRPATPLPDSLLRDNPQATATTSVAATAPAVAARAALVAGATGLVGRAVLARLLADKQ